MNITMNTYSISDVWYSLNDLLITLMEDDKSIRFILTPRYIINLIKTSCQPNLNWIVFLHWFNLLIKNTKRKLKLSPCLSLLLSYIKYTNRVLQINSFMPLNLQRIYDICQQKMWWNEARKIISPRDVLYSLINRLIEKWKNLLELIHSVY